MQIENPIYLYKLHSIFLADLIKCAFIGENQEATGMRQFELSEDFNCSVLLGETEFTVYV